jgi:tetratricopeptide (TPR) repeat protein
MKQLFRYDAINSAQPERRALINQLLKSRHLLAALCISLFCAIIYSNTLDSPFVFDDIVHISRNPHIRLTRLNVEKFWDAAFKSPLSNRPVANLSLALNYYFGKYDPRGYHMFNIAVHLINGILVYLLAVTIGRQVFDMSRLQAPQYRSFPVTKHTHLSVTLMATLAALVFVGHPLQVQSATYIVQRMNSLAAAFYLLSFLLYIRGRLAQTRFKLLTFLAISLLCWVLALGSKQIAASLPFVIIAYEWYFFRNLSVSWLRRNAIYLLLPCALFSLIVFIFLGSHPFERISAIYVYRDFTMEERVLTQFRVVIFYITLILYPHPARLNLIHDFSISHSLVDPITTLISLLCICALLATSIWVAKRNRLISFSILWFLGNLVIESSVIGAEMLWEYRLYLPMFGVALVFGYVFSRLINKRLWVMTIPFIIIMCLGTITYQRNRVWQNDVQLWRDVLSKNPESARAHLNLGSALMPLGRLDEAIFHYREALRTEPYYIRAHNNIALALKEKGNLDEAIEHYRTALKIKPKYVDAHNNLALALREQGHLDEAIAHYRKALRINPHAAEVHNNLGMALRERGELDEAIKHYKEAVRLDPLLSDAHVNLAVVLADKGRPDGAVSHFKESLRLRPDDWQAHAGLGNTLAEQGRLNEAIEHLSLAVKIRPDYAQGYNNIGLVMAAKGKVDEAISHYRKALEIDPDSQEAHNNLALALAKKGDLDVAISHYRKALEIDPDSPELLMNLGNALARQGLLDQAAKRLSEALEIRPDYAEAHNNLGIVWARQGDLEKAIAHFSEALRLRPDYTEARHNLGLARAQSATSPKATGSGEP